MGQRVTRPLWVLICFAIFATLGSAVQTSAQDRPRYGASWSSWWPPSRRASTRTGKSGGVR